MLIQAEQKAKDAQLLQGGDQFGAPLPVRGPVFVWMLLSGPAFASLDCFGVSRFMQEN